MFLLHFVLCCLAIYTDTEGRIVRGIIGRNVSFSFTISNLTEDSILIKHNESDFVLVWPEYNNYLQIEQPDRVRVLVGNKTASDTVTVTVDILNLRKTDLGMYNAMSQWNSMEIKDSVLLEAMDEMLIPKIEMFQNNQLSRTLVLKCRLSSTPTGKFVWKLNGSLIETNSRYFQNDTFLFITNITADDMYNLYKCKKSGSEFESDQYSIQIYIDRYTTKTSGLIEDTAETNYYWTKTLSKKEDTKEIYNYPTAAIAPNVDAQGVPSERHLLYIIFGMGAILAATFFACILYKIRISLLVDRGSNNQIDCNKGDGTESLPEVNQSGNYWTIVSNAEGELSTAIETDIELRRKPLQSGPNRVSGNRESEESVRSDEISVSQFDDYLNPINSSTVEFDGYIHPVHSDPVNTGFVSLCSLSYI